MQEGVCWFCFVLVFVDTPRAPNNLKRTSKKHSMAAPSCQKGLARCDDETVEANKINCQFKKIIDGKGKFRLCTIEEVNL